ncbi:MAG: crotonase/enoyl-CoA hydratase family protein [Thermoanaerobaculia bacterium]|nr:crotonase/enoyl-CoA hydratase family protein [Thermoanaerobaculia bacterium]
MTVRTEQDGEVWTVILARPEVRNAVNGPTAAALFQAFRRFEDEPGARVAVLWGEGGTFCSGADLSALGTDEGNEPEPEEGAPMGPTRTLLTKPVLAAVEGHAVAGGLELALWCDLRVAAESAVFGVFCRRWGVPLIDGGTVRLPRIVGVSRALEMILTGRPVGAREALRWGLANRVVPDGETLDAARELAREIASFPPTCLRNDRLSLYRSLGEDLDRGLEEELALGLETLESGEAEEGAARFLEDRDPGS